MIICGIAIVLLSAAFFVLWQYLESPWLIFGYVFAVLAVCGVYFFIQRRRYQRIPR